MITDNTPKELFDFIRTIDVSNQPDLKTILQVYSWDKLSIEEILNTLRNSSNEVLLIDARSEKEFEESAIPFGKIFPVLKNSERHNVGLVYKKYSQVSALWLAMQYADPKKENLKKFLDENNASEKNIIIYCWRGGGRSSYLSKMICDLGYKTSTLIGGYKSYRNEVNNFYSQESFPFELLELSGLTGCGKSELLQSVSDELPVIDLEFAAKHFSSLLGHIPYKIRNFAPVTTQTSFENNIYSQIYFNQKPPNTQNTQHTQNTPNTPFTFLIESESRRIGFLEMPKKIYDKLQTAKTVRIICSVENRVKRIVRDYFGDDLRGIDPMLKIMNDKGKFFKQQLSTKVFQELISLLENGRVDEFSEIMIVDYYDRKYIDKGKIPVAEIILEDIETGKEQLKEIFKNYIKLQK